MAPTVSPLVHRPTGSSGLTGSGRRRLPCGQASTALTIQGWWAAQGSRMTFRGTVKRLLPPVVSERIVHWRGSDSDFVGDFATFDAARAASDGYDAPRILDKVTESALKVVRGVASYERDSIAFVEPSPAYPLLAELLRIYAKDRRLAVLDLGGSLGSVYFPTRKYMSEIPSFVWGIVEQKSFVERGKHLFATDELRFFESLRDCQRQISPNVVLMASSLQYMESPYSTLEEVTELNTEYLIIDRTPFLVGSRDRLAIQKVPESIYGGSYPAWLLSLNNLVERASRNWEKISEWQALGGAQYKTVGKIEYVGLAFKRKSR